MADEKARTEEEPDVEAHGTSGDRIEGTSGLHDGTSGDRIEGTSGLHEDDSDDVEAHMFTQGSSSGISSGTSSGTSV